MTNPNPAPTLTAEEIEAATADLRTLLARNAYPLEKLHQAITDLTDSAARTEAYAADADAETGQCPPETEYAQQWRNKAEHYRRTAAVAHARADTVRAWMKTTTGRSHVHQFAAHPLTGNIICACGLTEIAAQTLDPDFVTSCCGCAVSKDGPGGRPHAPNAITYCFACQGDSAVIHRDQWQPAVCAACGKTWAEAGCPRSWTTHWRTKNSATTSAQSCGTDCADKVEARRKPSGILYRIARSATGHIKPDPPH
ncbi:hypothetical protein [Nocardia sp. CA-120079]|uniref:hypothetical protein n=1 Tax=Nocardia sp. CA-120079 TaxID=3239974 RepID=UPI003D9755B2